MPDRRLSADHGAARRRHRGVGLLVVYWVGGSAMIVKTWTSTSDTLPPVAIVVVALASVALGWRLRLRALAGPLVLTAVWLAIGLAATDRRQPGEEAPTARGLALFYLTVGTAAAEVGVLLGAACAFLADRPAAK